MPSFFCLPAEVLEKILVCLDSASIVCLLEAIQIAGNDESRRRFERVGADVLENVRLYEELCQTHPVIIETIRKKMPDLIFHPKDGLRMKRVVECLSDAMKEQDFETKTVSVENSPDYDRILGDNFIFEDSTNWIARFYQADPKTTAVEIFSDDFCLVKRVLVDRIASGASIAFRGMKLFWITRDANSIYTFLHLKMKGIHAADADKPVESIPISKYGKKMRRIGVTRILVNATFLVTFDSMQFLAFALPSLCSFRRKLGEVRNAHLLDASLEGLFLYISDNEKLDVWNLKSQSLIRTVTMSPSVQMGTRILRTPYLFYRVDRPETFPQSPPEWAFMVFDESLELRIRRIPLEIDTFLNRFAQKGRSDHLILRLPTVDRRYQLVELSTQKILGFVDLDYSESLNEMFYSGFRIVARSSIESGTIFQSFNYEKAVRNRMK